jgi:heme oxygenase
MKEDRLAASERRFDLRERTRSVHERLDTAVGSFKTVEQYRCYLIALRRFRAAMDGELKRIVWPTGWTFRPTALAAALDKDADDMSLAPSERITLRLDLSENSALLGALYVLEGSALGARILRQRAAALGLDENFGARHLAVMSKDIAQWQSFLLLLDEAVDFDAERAAASANAVFALAVRCFESDVVVAQ